jgi:amino acid transporter
MPGQQLQSGPYGGYPGYGQAPPQYPGFGVPPAPPPNPSAMRVDSIEGTQFGVAYPAVPPTSSGTSIASLVAGIISILVSFVVGCFGLTGSTEGWGPAVAGAFAVLAAFIGAGAVGAGINSTRQIRRSGGTVRGRGMAVAGISCGGSGIGLTVLFFLGAVALTAGS